MTMTALIYVVVGGLVGWGVAFLRSRKSVGARGAVGNAVAFGGMAGLFLHMAVGEAPDPRMRQSTANVRAISDSDYEAEVAKSELPVVMDFFATWCGPCKRMAPIVEGLAAEFKGEVKVVKVDVDQAPELARRYNISGIPALVFLKEGKVVNTSVGLRSKEDLRQAIRELRGPRVASSR